MKQPQCGGGCLGAPMRALSRACDSACNLYVRGMSGCARHVPSGAAGAVGRGGYGRSASASSMFVHASSDRVEDLVRAAAAKQSRRTEAADAAAGKKGAAATARQSRRVAPAEAADAAGKKVHERKAGAAPGSKVHERKAGAAAAMETIAEDAPCEFGEDGACVLPLPSRRRRAAAGGLATRSGGFSAVKAGSEVLVR